MRLRPTEDQGHSAHHETEAHGEPGTLSSVGRCRDRGGNKLTLGSLAAVTVLKSLHLRAQYSADVGGYLLVDGQSIITLWEPGSSLHRKETLEL